MTEKCIELPCYGIRIELYKESGTDDAWSGRIESPQLKDACPFCARLDCPGECLESRGNASEKAAEERESRLSYNAAIDGIESMVLAHACAGIDVTSPAYVEGLETAVEAVSHAFG
jgi:hypothetical protein